VIVEDQCQGRGLAVAHLPPDLVGEGALELLGVFSGEEGSWLESQQASRGSHAASFVEALPVSISSTANPGIRPSPMASTTPPGGKANIDIEFVIRLSCYQPLRNQVCCAQL